MKKILIPIALSLALGTAACGKSDDANTGANDIAASSDVVLNDEGALGNAADASSTTLGNEGAIGSGNTSTDATLGSGNTVSGNGFQEVGGTFTHSPGCSLAEPVARRCDRRATLFRKTTT